MTASFRLLAACLLSLLALVAGWAAAAPAAFDDPLSSGGAGMQISQPGGADIEAHVTAILNSGLFPEARRVVGSGEPQAGTAEALAEALQDPSLSALVKRGGEWRIHLYAGYEGPSVRAVGDQLVDGWAIETIEPTAVVLARDDEVRRIEVFRAEPDTQ
ncbi:hypothetical protein AY599_28075 [Leptolyngbya valderiana BDU 20041]|nr:hypothetical protein AY599_28075 [Leptolyngbya valderiana BDU 20041]